MCISAEGGKDARESAGRRSDASLFSLANPLRDLCWAMGLEGVWINVLTRSRARARIAFYIFNEEAHPPGAAADRVNRRFSVVGCVLLLGSNFLMYIHEKERMSCDFNNILIVGRNFDNIVYTNTDFIIQHLIVTTENKILSL